MADVQDLSTKVLINTVETLGGLVATTVRILEMSVI